MRKLVLAAALALAATSALAQSVVLQAGPWKPGDAPIYSISGGAQTIVVDGGLPLLANPAQTGYPYASGGSWSFSPTIPAANVVGLIIDAAAYGVRAGGSTATTLTGSITSAKNSLTLSSIGDFQVGDDILVDRAGASYSAGAPSSISISGGASGSSSCAYYFATDDGHQGLSAAASATISGVNAAPTVDAPINITFASPIVSPAAVWKNCGSGDVELLPAQVSMLATMTAGSGYTPGVYGWTATGGACTTEPAGFIVVKSDGTISTTLGRVDPSTPGAGCTSAPSVSVPAGAGAGSGGAIALSLAGTYQDGGIVPSAVNSAWLLPYYIPTSHTTSAQNDDLIATIGAISGNVVTLCALGAGSGGAACTPMKATNTVSGAIVRHSWTRALQAALTAANPNNDNSGLATVQLPCGMFDVESGALANSSQFVQLTGGGAFTSNYCAEIVASGPGPTLYNTGKTFTVQNIYWEGENKTSGYAIENNKGSLFSAQWNRFNHNPGNIQVLGTNGAYIYNNQQSNYAWADGYADFDFESVSTALTLGVFAFNNYSNDAGNPTTRAARTTRDGWRFNDAETFYGQDDEISDAEGHGWSFISTSGALYSTANGGQTKGNQFYHCESCDSEYAALDEFYVASGFGSMEFVGFANGSLTGHELNVLPGQQFQWRGGSLKSAWLSNVLFQGTQDILANTQVLYGSQGSLGTYPGVELAASAQADLVDGNTIGDIKSHQFHSYAVQLDAPISLTAAGAISTSSPNITMALASTGSLSRGMSVYDSTLGQTLGTVFYFTGATLTLTARPAYNGAGTSDVLVFTGGGNSVCGNAYNGNVNNTTNDISLVPQNNNCPNPGDSAPGYGWDNVHSDFLIGPNASYANILNPGLLIEQTNSGGVVEQIIRNDGTGAGTAAEYSLSLTAYANAYSLSRLDFNGGAPFFDTTIGAGTVGGIKLDASGGGSAAPVILVGGSSAGVLIGPIVTDTGISAAGAACFSASGVLSSTAGVCPGDTGFAPTASPTFTGTVTMPDNGTWTTGGINGSVIGAATPLAGTFTTLISGSGAACPGQIVGGAGQALFQATGTNCGAYLGANGTGIVTLANGNGTLLTAAEGSAATMVDHVTATASAAGSPGVVTLGGGGSDTNISTNITSKGSGIVQINGVQADTVSGALTLTNHTIAFASNTMTGVAPLASPTFTGTVTLPDSTAVTSTGFAFGASGFTANGTTATALTSLGPSGAHATVQEWLTAKDSSGNTRYIPAF